MQPLTDNSERRIRARLTQVCPIRIRVGDGAAGVAGRMFNHSETGIYFETDVRLSPGAEIFIGAGETSATDAAVDYACRRARVAWCRELADEGHYAFGCGVTFCEAGARAAAAAAPAGERRRHARRPCRKPVQLVDENAFYKGVAEDISASGVFVTSGKQPRPGQKVTMGIPDRTGRMVMVQARVVWSNGSGFGLKFIRKD